MPAQSLHLSTRETLLLPHQGRTTIRCLSGQIWITMTHDRTDHFLCTGMGLSVNTEQRCVIEAIHAARISLEIEPDNKPVQFHNVWRGVPIFLKKWRMRLSVNR